MAAGRAVVATDVGGVREAVADGESGIVVRPSDPAALTRAIVRVLDDEDLCRRMGRAGRSRVLERFTKETMQRRYEELYRSVLGGAPLSSTA
jgi:glycosyltransferase involved in cell wall biosynthesis